MNISLETRQAYAEIDNFIELLDEYHKNKIPQKLREYYKKEKDHKYIKIIYSNKPVKEQNLKKQTLAIIAMLNLKYWCEDEEEKNRLKKIYIENDRKHQEELREKYNPDDLFKFKNKNSANMSVPASQQNEKEKNEIYKIEKQGLFQRIIDFLSRKIKKK